MKVLLPLLLALIFTVSISLPIYAIDLTQGSYIYDVNVAEGSYLYSYTYNYTIDGESPLTYSLTIELPNGTILFNRTFTNSAQYFPNYVPLDGENVSILYNGTVSIGGVSYQEFTGKASFNNIEVPINAYYLNNVLFKLNGSIGNVTINIIDINTTTQPSPVGQLDYVPIIVVLVVIVVAIILMVKLGKI
jgi:hypothetical protein